MFKKCVLFIVLFISYCIANASPILSIKKWNTKNGVPVYFVRSSAVPMLKINILFKAGSYYDSKQFGLASLSSNLLPEGTKELSARALSDALIHLGANMTTDTAKEFTGIQFNCLTQAKYFANSIKLFNRILTTPSFKIDAINRIKQQTLTSLKLRAQDPAAVANIKLLALLFKNTPFAHEALGTAQTLKIITQNDIKAFYTQYFVQKNAAIFLVGDITTAVAKQTAGNLLQGMRLGEKSKKIEAAPKITGKTIRYIKFPTNQTYIVSATLLPRTKENILFPLIVSNYIFGANGLNSILGSVLRQKHSISYSATSSFTSFRSQKIWAMRLQAKNSQAALALKLSQKTLIDYEKNGPNNIQLKDAKRFLSNYLPLTLSSNAKITRILMAIYVDQLPINYVDTYRHNISLVNKENIMLNTRKYINPNNMITVIVGSK